jgi:4-hydroxybenzoate polyprenyltransferase
VSGWRRTIGAYAELSRLSNLPTCATNVLVGCAIGARDNDLDWPLAATMTVAVALLYVGGAALNDLLDEPVDREERPGRALPSGRAGRRGVRWYVAVCLGCGLAVLATAGPIPLLLGAVLVGSIVLYDLLHRAVGASVLLLGACRGLVYLTVAAAAGWPLPGAAWWLSGGLGLYIVLLSVVARIEVSGRPHRRFAAALLLPAAALAPVLFVQPERPEVALVAGATLVIWLLFTGAQLLGRPPRVPAAVHGWLAGICLVDGLYLALLDEPPLVAVAALCFLLTVLAQRVVPGT